MSETRKAHARRELQGFYRMYCPADGPGLDIGSGSDPVHPDAVPLQSDVSSPLGARGWLRWDKPQGDATDLAEIDPFLPATVANGFRFRTIYASHILEHLDRPVDALRRWGELLAPGGHLIVVVPHRDLYERRRDLPSRFNREHRSFWLPFECDPPSTYSLSGVLQEAFRWREWGSVEAGSHFVYRFAIDVCDNDYDPDLPDTQDGEFSIEAVITKSLVGT